MKKLEVHVFPSKTASGKSYIFSFWGAIIAVVAVVAAVLGFVLFSPVQILDNVTSGNVTNVYRQNAAIKKELKEIRASVDSSILRAEETRVLRDSTLKVGGLGFMLDGSADSKCHENITNIKGKSYLIIFCKAGKSICHGNHF